MTPPKPITVHLMNGSHIQVYRPKDVEPYVQWAIEEIAHQKLLVAQLTATR